MKNPENIYDDSTSLMVQQLLLDDGRKVEAEFWTEDGYSYLTYRIDGNGLEGMNGPGLIDYLNSQGMEIAAKHREGSDVFHRTRNGIFRIELTLTVGVSDD